MSELTSTDLEQLNIQATQSAKPYMAHFAWPTVLFVVFIITGFTLNLWAFIQGLIPMWLATVLLGVFTYFAYTPLHEAVHSNIHGKHAKLRWLNELCGYLVAPLIAVSFISHRYEHFVHHGFLNQPGKDPDLLVGGMHKGFIYILPYSLKFLWLQNSYFVSHQWHKVNIQKRLIYCAEITFLLGWRIAVLALFPSWQLAIVIIAGFIMGGMFTAYWFAFRPHYPNESQERYKDTTTLVIPKLLKPFEWFWLGQNYHPIHHLFPRIPFYQYKTVHEKILPSLKAHGTPETGAFDPLPR